MTYKGYTIIYKVSFQKNTIEVLRIFNQNKPSQKFGKNFIHVHHIKPLSEINQEYKVNPIKDLIPVCPNCHAMLYKKVPTYSLEELKNIIKKDS